MRSVKGLYRQRVKIEPTTGGTPQECRRRTLDIHASQLVPFNMPYQELKDLDVSSEADPESSEDEPEQPRNLPDDAPCKV